MQKMRDGNCIFPVISTEDFNIHLLLDVSESKTDFEKKQEP